MRKFATTLHTAMVCLRSVRYAPAECICGHHGCTDVADSSEPVSMTVRYCFPRSVFPKSQVTLPRSPCERNARRGRLRPPERNVDAPCRIRLTPSSLPGRRNPCRVSRHGEYTFEFAANSGAILNMSMNKWKRGMRGERDSNCIRVRVGKAKNDGRLEIRNFVK